MAETKEVKPRKAKARNRDVIIGCIEERVSILEPSPSRVRLEELLDELSRALGSKQENGE